MTHWPHRGTCDSGIFLPGNHVLNFFIVTIEMPDFFGIEVSEAFVTMAYNDHSLEYCR
jgi:hypothetical protein